MSKERATEILKKFNASKKEDYGLTMLNSTEIEKVPTISTGILSLDLIIGGGLPIGRIIEIFGAEAGGKTTTVLHAIAAAQRQGKVAAFVDAEHSLDPSYARQLGVDLDSMLLQQPQSGEQALEVVDKLAGLLSTGDLIVIDSVAALVPQTELDGEMGLSHMGLHARLMSQSMRKLNGSLSKNGVIAFFVNQTRQKIGISYGDPTTTTGGNALKFYSSVRIDVRKGSQIKEKEDVVGAEVVYKIVKNKVYPPYKTAKTQIKFGEGIPVHLDALGIGVAIGIVQQSGSWFSFKEQRLGQGMNNAATALKDNPELFQTLVGDIRKMYKI